LRFCVFPQVLHYTIDTMIAREGVVILFMLGFISSLLFVLKIYFLAIPCTLFFFFSLYFLRDPRRETPYGPLDIVSPADGKILEISETASTYEISIFMSLLDVHVNRVPYGGVVKSIERRGKKFLRAFLKEADFENVQCETHINSPGIADYSVIQISGIIARRIVNNLSPEKVVNTGERMGIILYSSKVKLILPKEKIILKVKPGDRVKGGITLIAEIKESL